MFPGATASIDDADYALVGAPFDATASFYPGARFGPDRIRRFAHALEDYDRRTGQRFSALHVADTGDVEPGDDPEALVEYLRSTIRGLAGGGAIPVTLGGEHTVSLAGVRATDAATYVAVDAHLDLRDRYRDRAVCHATVARRALETADRAVIVGARSGSDAGWERAAAGDVTVVQPSAVPDWRPTLEEPIYLSVDVDAVDPGYAPATGTPAPFGLDPSTVRDVISTIAPAACGFDVVEVTDRDAGQTATLAAALLRRFVHDHAAARR